MMPREQNFKLIVEYDGSAYHGWQRQKQETTIQGEIERAARQLTGKPVTLIGSGRTDAGVHARGQVANFHSATRLAATVIQRGLNALLPDDIVIGDCRVVHDRFHSRYDAQFKTYCYTVLNRPVPGAIGRQYAWHIKRPLDIKAMREALECLVGTYDFKAFEGTGSPRNHTTRVVTQAELVAREESHLQIHLTANGFLKHMVRNIVGTLVDVGAGKIDPADMEAIRESRDRSLAGITAPGHGLCLMKVYYDENDWCAGPNLETITQKKQEAFFL